jgi:hypothetical protein
MSPHVPNPDDDDNDDSDSDLDVPNPHHLTARVTLVAAILALGWGVAALLFALTHRRAPDLFSGGRGFFVIGGLVVGCGGVFLLLFYAAARADAARVELFRRQFRAGHYLVRWRYSDQSWRALRATVSPDESRDAAKLNRALAIIGGGGLLVALFFLIAPRFLDLGPFADPALAGAAAVLGAICLAGIPIAALHRRRRRAALERPHVAILSTIGAYANGKWLMWGTFQHTLSDVQVIGGSDGQPLMLELLIRYGDHDFPERILVPAGQEELARRVAQAIKQAPAATSGGGAQQLTQILRNVSRLRRTLR